MLLMGQNGHSPFPWNLPVYNPDYAVFFGVLYLVLLVLGVGLGIVFWKSFKDANDPDHHSDH